MNTKIDDGGPAFPILDKANFCGTGYGDGMTLLDHFAGQVAEGDASAGGEAWDFGVSDEWLEDRARLYYRIASAMVKVRKEFLS